MTSRQQIEKFVACIFDPMDWVEIRYIGKQQANKSWFPAAKIPEQDKQFQDANRSGFNIHIGVNPRKGKGQSGDDAVSLCRCLFADFDHIEAAGQFTPADLIAGQISEAILPLPTLLLNSGHGVHSYWRLSAPIEPEQWRQIQHRLNKTLGSDPAIKNPERLMRLPGFRNLKEPPADCQIVEADPSRVCALEQILPQLAKLPKPKPEPQPAARAGERPGEMEVKGRAMLYASKWPGVAEGAGRNREGFKHACQLRRDFDLADSDAWAILTDWNTRNNPPLSDRELKHTFESAIKYGKKAAGSKLNEPKRSRPARQDPPPEPKPNRMAEMDAYIDAVEAGRLRTIAWPWHYLTEGTQVLKNGTLVIISGGPGAAKSLFVLQAIRFWLAAGEKVTYYGMEGTRESYMMRCLSQCSGVSEVTRTDYVKDNAAEVRALRKSHEAELSRFADCLRIDGDMPAEFLDQIGVWIHNEAQRGQRLIICDPITLALKSGKAWVADQRFVRGVNRTAREFGCNVLLVSHPEKGIEDPSLLNIAGGASYSRFSDGVLTVKKHDAISGTVATRMGRTEAEWDQTITIAKAKEGSLVGRRLAYEFDGASLNTNEIGIIAKG